MSPCCSTNRLSQACCPGWLHEAHSRHGKTRPTQEYMTERPKRRFCFIAKPLSPGADIRQCSLCLLPFPHHEMVEPACPQGALRARGTHRLYKRVVRGWFSPAPHNLVILPEHFPKFQKSEKVITLLLSILVRIFPPKIGPGYPGQARQEDETIAKGVYRRLLQNQGRDRPGEVFTPAEGNGQVAQY